MIIILIQLCISSIVYKTTFGTGAPHDITDEERMKNFSLTKGSEFYTCYERKPKNISSRSNTKLYLKEKLKGECFTFTHTGYWFFSFCPFDKLLQYRLANDGVTAIDKFYLANETENQVYTPIDNFVRAKYSNGAICEVTRKPRTTTIEFICDNSADGDGNVVSISEPHMCDYLVRFATPYACGMTNGNNETLVVVQCFN